MNYHIQYRPPIRDNVYIVSNIYDNNIDNKLDLIGEIC